jgi:hypothetical protein
MLGPMSVMIDWVNAEVQTSDQWRGSHDPFPLGAETLHVNGVGEIDRRWPDWQLALGSFDAGLRWKSLGYGIRLSGNPTKVRLGHNLWGPWSLPELLDFSLGVVGLDRDFEVPRLSDCSVVKPTRLDLTRSYRFASQADAEAWIQAHAVMARSPRGASVSKGNTTFYLNSGSSYWSMKVYAKQPELLAHPPLDKSLLPSLLAWADGVVRFEISLFSRVLSKLGPVESLDASVLWNEYFAKCTGLIDEMEMVNVAADEGVIDRVMSIPEVRQLSNPARLALRLWLNRDYAAVRDAPQNTRYRWRREVRKATGLDIFAECPKLSFFADGRVVLDPEGWDPVPLELDAHQAS